MSKTKQVIGAVTNLEYFVGAATFSLDQIIKQGTPSIQYYLPYWGLAFGVLSVVSSACRFHQIYSSERPIWDDGARSYDDATRIWDAEKGTYDSASPNTYESHDISQIFNVLAGSYLSLESFQSSAVLFSGLFSGLAICSAASLISNSYAILNKPTSLSVQLIADMTRNTLELVGWTLLTFGNPIGWYIVAAAATFMLGQNLVAAVGFFKEKMNGDSQQLSDTHQNQPGIQLQ